MVDREAEMKKIENCILKLKKGQDVSLEEAAEIYNIQRREKDKLSGFLYYWIYGWYETIEDILPDRTGNFVTSLPTDVSDMELKELHRKIMDLLPPKEKARLVTTSSSVVPGWIKKNYDPNRLGKIRYLKIDKRMYSLDEVVEDVGELLDTFKPSDSVENILKNASLDELIGPIGDRNALIAPEITFEDQKRAITNTVIEKYMKSKSVPFICFSADKMSFGSRFYFVTDKNIIPEIRQAAKDTVKSMIEVAKDIAMSALFSFDAFFAMSNLHEEMHETKDWIFDER